MVSKDLDIRKNVFLGQVYPSGNVYLKSFERNARREWSNAISFTALRNKQKSASLKNYQAAFVREINIGNENSFVNFPKEEKDKMHVDDFTEEDFFETILDEMPEDEDVGLYQAKGKIQFPFAVFAFNKELDVIEIAHPPKSLLRPLTKKEKLKVAALRRESKIETKGWECTTIPAFLDSAKQILTFKIKGTNYAGRISGYSNPGCLGHLADIYILDIFQNGNLKQSFELNHYEGAI